MLQHTSTSLQRQAGIESRKWRTKFGFTKENALNVLGLAWNEQQDHLAIALDTDVVWPKIWTRCNLLKTIAKMYDPFGLVGPDILLRKLLLQPSCKEHGE